MHALWRSRCMTQPQVRAFPPGLLSSIISDAASFDEWALLTQRRRGRPASTPACARWGAWMATASRPWRAWATLWPASTKCRVRGCPASLHAGPAPSMPALIDAACTGRRGIRKPPRLAVRLLHARLCGRDACCPGALPRARAGAHAGAADAGPGRQPVPLHWVPANPGCLQGALPPTPSAAETLPH